MKTFKHIITWDCDRSCNYCINKRKSIGLNQGRPPLRKDVRDIYKELRSQGYQQIIITGGEPTLSEDLENYLALASKFFRRVTLFTANPSITISPPKYSPTNVVLTVHTDKELYNLPTTKVNYPIYVALMEDSYAKLTRQDIDIIIRKKYASLTIREYSDTSSRGYVFYGPEDFSYKVSKGEDCLKGKFLTPDLKFLEGKDLFNGET